MAKQVTDIHKTVGRLTKSVKALCGEFSALHDSALLMYSNEMNIYITKVLVRRWHRYLRWLKVKRFFGIKSANMLTKPIKVKLYTHGEQ